jgi:hypothetical protein
LLLFALILRCLRFERVYSRLLSLVGRLFGHDGRIVGAAGLAKDDAVRPFAP